jgi:hypothetical protein
MRTFTAAGLLLALLAGALPAADARGGHAFARDGGHMRGVHGGASGAGALAAGQRHANDPYTKAASDEEDRLLNSRLKSICRGC